MHSSSRILFLLAAVALGPGQRAVAQDPDPCPAPKAIVTPQAVLSRLGIPADTSGIMLWRFEGEAGRGHVFGTVHLGPPFITRGPAQALLAIRDSEVFASELLMDAAAQAEFMSRAQVADGAEPRITAQILGPALFARYLNMARRRGIPPALARRLTPWAAFLSIGRPPIPPGSSLDETLQQVAQRMQRKVVGLQRVGELMEALDGLLPSDQIAILADTVCQQRVMGTYYRHLLEVYSSGSPEAVVAFGRAGREEDPVLARLEARMVTERNGVFVARLLELLEGGSVFVALGAQHLPGPAGVLQRLRDAGFSVHRAP